MSLGIELTVEIAMFERGTSRLSPFFVSGMLGAKIAQVAKTATKIAPVGQIYVDITRIGLRNLICSPVFGCPTDKIITSCVPQLLL